MMEVKEQVPLSSLTTFKVGGPARLVLTCSSGEEVAEAIAQARSEGLPFYVLGEGSNVVASDEGFEGVIIRVASQDISFDGEQVRAGAGAHWDTLVAQAAERGLWGVENLAGIPGTVGAAPVQNIGAYGAELISVFEHIEAFDADSGKVVRLTRDDCAFGYRDSRFKHERGLVILSVALSLKADGAPKVEYKDLLAARDAGKDLSTPAAIGAVVREVRSHKFPDLKEFGTAGSFFKNPILSQEAYEALVTRFGDVPTFPHPQGVKIPLAFVLDRVLSLRGFRLGKAFLFGSQPLVLTLEEGGTSADVEALAKLVEQKVFDATGIAIEREVRMFPEK